MDLREQWKIILRNFQCLIWNHQKSKYCDKDSYIWGYCNFRTVKFDDVRERTKLQTGSFKILTQKTYLECSMTCVFYPQCKSFSFCPNLCILYEIDAFSISRKLIRDNRCIYSGLQRITYPQCSDLVADFSSKSVNNCNLGTSHNQFDYTVI